MLIGIIAVSSATFLIAYKNDAYPLFVEEYIKFVSLYEINLNEEELELIYDVASYTALLLGVVYIISGYGLFTLREWGRILTVIIAGFNVLYSLFLFFVNPLAGLEVAVNVLIIWYLMRPEIKRNFGRKVSIEERILGSTKTLK